MSSLRSSAAKNWSGRLVRNLVGTDERQLATIRQRLQVDAEASTLPADVDQQFTRATESGADIVWGRMRAPIAPGEQIVHLHVAFCPALASLPELNVETIDGPPASVELGQVLLQGARFDIRLEQPGDQAQSVVIEFYGRTK